MGKCEMRRKEMYTGKSGRNNYAKYGKLLDIRDELTLKAKDFDLIHHDPNNVGITPQMRRDSNKTLRFEVIQSTRDAFIELRCIDSGYIYDPEWIDFRDMITASSGTGVWEEDD